MRNWAERLTRLLNATGWTHAEAGKQFGRSWSSVALLLREDKKPRQLVEVLVRLKELEEENAETLEAWDEGIICHVWEPGRKSPVRLDFLRRGKEVPGSTGVHRDGLTEDAAPARVHRPTDLQSLG